MHERMQLVALRGEHGSIPAGLVDFKFDTNLASLASKKEIVKLVLLKICGERFRFRIFEARSPENDAGDPTKGV